jgi:hypothetical protein
VEPVYVIWSKLKNMWWRADHQGYTPHLEEAGNYTAHEAGIVCVTHDVPPGHNVGMSRKTAEAYGDDLYELLTREG